MKMVSPDVSGSLHGRKAEENDRIGCRLTLRGALPNKCEVNAIDDNDCLETPKRSSVLLFFIQIVDPALHDHEWAL